MFSRNILFTVKLAHSCKRPLLQSGWSSRVGHVRGELRNSFHNSRRQIRRPALEPDPLVNIPCDLGPLCSKNLYRPFLFAVGLSTASIIGCAVWEYETLRTHASAFIKRPASWFNTQQKRVLAHTKSESGPIRKWWNSLRDSEKVFYPILGLNVLVFGMWRVRSLQPLMVKYFCSNPAARTVCLPMLLSTFSHYSPMHLAANMYVLYSFMPAAVAALGKEQFVTMYLSAGVISSFASFVFKVMMNQPGLSLGASGAIMAVLSFVCVQYPDTKLSIIFLPMYTFAAGTAIKAIMGLDVAGVVFGWKFFDHAAHLGGALFGIAWHQWGSSHIWGNRDYFLQYYHAIRKTDSR